MLGDCFYLPFELGPQAADFMADLRQLLKTGPSEWGDLYARVTSRLGALASLVTQLTALENRELFHTFYRRLLTLSDEISLLEGYLRWRASKPGADEMFISKAHRPKVFRGGLLAELQQLLPMNRLHL